MGPPLKYEIIFAERTDTFVVHTAGCFLAFESGVVENLIFYTVEEEDKTAIADWVKVYTTLKSD